MPTVYYPPFSIFLKKVKTVHQAASYFLGSMKASNFKIKSVNLVIQSIGLGEKQTYMHKYTHTHIHT